ncbi:hypothetical protein CJ030_MR4G021339 [Morella rubra]|uniref:Uncharacterized protein n=1 Tax=Morella rubra TaxID=262757 RepID=A0A6A1VVJ8_9ROSI|nr:hypothetical protein CJ030_MR4G021339 [Morella rubra]
MTLETIQKNKEDEIMKLLEDAETHVTTTVLTGVAGVGKTWMAREISKRALRKGLAYETLWLFLNPEDGGSEPNDDSFLEDIARQLSLLPTADQEWEVGIVDEEKEEAKKEKLLRKISSKLKKMRSDERRPPEYLLLILDGVPERLDLCSIIQRSRDLTENSLKEDLIGKKDCPPYKVLVTGRGVISKTEGSNSNYREVEIEPLSKAEAGSVLRARVRKDVNEPQLALEKYFNEIVKRSEGLPAAIVLMAEALNHIQEHDFGQWILEDAFEDAAHVEEGGNSEEATADKSSLLRFGYHMLPEGGKALMNWCWRSRQYFLQSGGLDYNELIAYWKLEEYIGAGHDRLEKAYEEGHRTLMELIDRGMLKTRGNLVTVEALALCPPDGFSNGYGGESSLGFPSLFEYGNWQRLGRIAPAEGMIKTLRSPKKWDQVSTLLIDGSRLNSKVAESFFEPMLELQVLALFNPRYKYLPVSFNKLLKLRLVILRGCDQLENIDPIRELGSLTLLEISDASSLKKIPDDVFDKMRDQLQSLKLSGLQVEVLPPSLFNLSKLRYLCLRGCSKFHTLSKLIKLENLEVLDLSGSKSLNKIEDKCFSILKLKSLDLSQTQIDHLPILKKLEALTRLILRNCACLNRVCILKDLSALQILDISGAIKLKEIPGASFDNKGHLKTLNLSKVGTSSLPHGLKNLQSLEFLDLSYASCLEKIDDDAFKNLKNLRHMNLSHTKIKNLPSYLSFGNLREVSIENNENLKELQLHPLTKLEVLNLSGCSGFTGFKDTSFDHMTRLRQLNLSGTQIEGLPCLSKLGYLCKLLLRDCIKLKKLPSLASPSKLEELDLGGATSLVIDGKVLEDMSHLRILNLSEVQLESLPSMFKLTNLSQLILRGCSGLENLPSLESLTALEVLDLSKTKAKISSLEELKRCEKIRNLFLRDCSSLEKLTPLETFRQLEVLDLWGTGLKDFPYEISMLAHLKKLDLPNLEDLPTALDWQNIKRLPEELNWAQCGIFKHTAGNGPRCMLVSGIEPFQFLKGKSDDLWATCFKEFYFSICSGKAKGKEKDVGWHRANLDFTKIYFKTLFQEEHGRYLEIFGFDSFPDGIEVALIRAQFVLLIENDFVKSLSDLAVGDVLKEINDGRTMAMEGCLLERCANIERIFLGDKNEVGVGKNLDILQVSNLPKLISVDSKNMQNRSFENLRKLYLDCCPRLEVVFSSQLPENLEILQVKFCDKLEKLFAPEGSGEHALKSLRTLHLVGLPKLVVVFSSLLPVNLEILQVKFCDELEELYGPYEFGALTSLRTLHLEGLPKLKQVFCHIQPENLEILQVKFCDKLEKLFAPDGSGERALKSLRTLHLVGLPKLVVVFSSLLPVNLEILQVKFCDELEELYGPYEFGALTSLRTLHLEGLPKLKQVFCHIQPENLEILQVKFCDKLEKLFAPDGSGERALKSLRTLHLVGLPKLKNIGGLQLSRIEDVKVRECPFSATWKEWTNQ